MKDDNGNDKNHVGDDDDDGDNEVGDNDDDYSLGNITYFHHAIFKTYSFPPKV